MFVKNPAYVLAAAAALAVGIEAPTAGAAGCQQDFAIPTSISGVTCSANGKSSTGVAREGSGGAGTRYTYKVKLNNGNTTFVMLLDGNGQRTKRREDGLGCIVAQDLNTGASFGTEQACNVSPAFSAVTLRVTVS